MSLQGKLQEEATGEARTQRLQENTYSMGSEADSSGVQTEAAQ